VVAGLCTALVSCTPGEEEFSIPPAGATADAFIVAWDEGKPRAMVRALDRRGRRKWNARRLSRLLARTRTGGDIRSIEVTSLGPVDQPVIDEPSDLEGNRVVASAPYEVTYRSRATPRPVVLNGDLEIVFDSDRDRWGVAWRHSMQWPGIEGARGFEVTRRWPRRAPILDRRGRSLAWGPSKSRHYPFGTVAGTTIGHIGVVTSKSQDDLDPDYRTGDLIGSSGLEASFERRLAGSPAARLSIVDRRGKTLKGVGRTRATPGRPVRTTLDITIQRAAEAAYGSTVGGAVVLEPATGNLLAVVSSSPFDPGNYVGVPGIAPFNRALSGLYPPGSSMKVVTASAALDSGEVTPTTTVTGPKDYKGVVNFESGVFGAIPFSDALQFSVNTAFAQVAEDLGSRKLTRYARAFGFNHTSDPGVEVAQSTFPYPQGLGDLMWGSIGQAQVLATPMEMATVAATIANHGTRMEPRIAMGVPREGERAVSRRTAGEMNTMMQAVVQAGTGVGAQVPGVAVAGKTGTAEVDVAGVRKNHAWFLAFAPATAPEVAVAVVSEYGGVGGKVAAPLASRILQSVLPLTS
jgi:cell division protein FtsI/penicillin-binding protein 2